jgi:hypothetical protein
MITVEAQSMEYMDVEVNSRLPRETIKDVDEKNLRNR